MITFLIDFLAAFAASMLVSTNWREAINILLVLMAVALALRLFTALASHLLGVSA